jgi:hypothetical protein
VGEVCTKEVLALSEEKERQLLNVSLVNQKHKNTIECIFSDVFRNSIVKQSLEGKCQHDIRQYDARELIVKEVEVISKETKSRRISL